MAPMRSDSSTCCTASHGPGPPASAVVPNEIIPAKIDLTLVGDDEALSRVNASSLFVSVDASIDEMLGTHTRKLKASDLTISNLPEGVAVDSSAIPEILLKVYKDDVAE